MKKIKDVILDYMYLIFSFIWLLIIAFSLYTNSVIYAVIGSTGFFGSLILHVLLEKKER